jgi:beta-glucosidase/6-phospho-beta-glucosidase/beta-galactosidase
VGSGVSSLVAIPHERPTAGRGMHAPSTESQDTGLLDSFFLGGFECSTHRYEGGPRLDLVAATAHDVNALRDYAALAQHGIRAVRDGIRWHLIERTPGEYDFASALSQVRAARQVGTQVIWDLCHYGWPEDLSPFDPAFGRRLAGLGRAFLQLLADEGETRPFVVPINEISFLAWIGGSEGKFPPFATGRGDELKRALVRAAIECIHAVREVAPQARIASVDPLINVVGDGKSPAAAASAEAYRQSQYAAWDMLAGRSAPELGGSPELLDVIGVNYYVHNQWVHAGHGEFVRMLRSRDQGYRPLASMLAELHARYQRPIFIAETGIEGRWRARWLRHITDQVCGAREAGVPVAGICLYPVADYPGWLDGRHCPAGLLGYANARGVRPVHRPLARELRRQQDRLTACGPAGTLPPVRRLAEGWLKNPNRPPAPSGLCA